MKTNSKVSKRIISLVLTVLLVLSMVPMSVFSAFAEEVSELAEGLPELSATIDTGTEVALSDADGDGYYDISTADELYAFSALVNGGNLSLNAELTADIVVNEGVMTAESEGARVWTPIGNDDSNSYTGTFDGNNKTVSGLYFNNSEADYIGLFGYVGENGAVNNTGVINSYFNGYYFVGGVVGVNAGTITNCYNTGTVSGDGHIGGVVGYNEGTVTSCNNTGTVNGSYNDGGVVGRNYGTITNCYNTGFVSGVYEVGGVVGMNYGTITNCYNTGKVSGVEQTGGVVGYNYYGTITNCYNTGFVSGSSYYVGGVAGDNYYGTITNCYNTGEVSGVYYIGGVAGDSYYGTSTNCYYLDTAYTGGIGKEDSADADDLAGSAEAKTADQFASGEVAYLLQGEQEELVWGQKIGTDELPTIGGDKVYYGYYSCADDVAEYTNNSNVVAERPDHNFVNGSCTACGVNALFYAERTVDYDGDVSDESKYFMQLEDALRYAEKSTQNTTTYYSECATVKILCNYAIDESVTVTVPSNVTLDLNGFELTNNGTINFESIDGFKVRGGNYTGDGTVKIDEYDGIIFENTLYYFGGEYTPGSSDKRDLAQEKDRTYFTAGEGYAVYKNADGAVLNLYNATINSNESAQSGAYTSAIYYSGNDSLTVNFYGENNIYSKAASDVVGIYANFGLVLNGLGENPIININCENATALSYGISSPDITINSGIVNIVIDNSGEYCIGIDGENITVANDAEIDITTGDASRRSVGIYANSSIVNEGEINTSFGEADTSAGVMVTGTNKISNKGTMNALVLQGIVTDDVINYDYYTSGNVVVNKGFSLFIEEGYNHAFTVAEGTSLLINEEASFDLSILSAEDISIMGEVIVDGGLSLPDGVSVLDIKDKITSTTDGGTVRVGDNSYCFENGKLKCTSEECHLTADDSTNVANCKRKTVCDICGAEYGDIDEYNHAGELIPEFRFDTPYETEDSKECNVELNLICEDCGECVETQSGYAKLTESAEGTDCLHPGYEIYETTFDIDGVEYTGTNKVTVKSDNHVGEFVNGFCTECGGYEPATLNDNGTPDDEWDDYYEISNAGQLYWFAELTANDQYAKAVLTDDIIVNEDLTAENLREWIAIGESSSMPYCGSFDGQGHFISGLYAKSELNYIGLFGAIGWGATISNLGIKDSYFEGNYYVGGIVGYNDFSYIKNCYAENVEVVAVSSGGALVGYNYGEVSNSYSTSGIIADTDYGTITNCYYLADVETEDGGKTAEQFASGEVAYLLQSGVVGEEIWDDELGEYVQTEPEHIWGQKISTDTYPVFGGDKVYQVENCVGELAYSNANENGQHNFVNGFCTVCDAFEPATLNEDGVYEIGNAGQLYWFADKVNNDYENFGSANAILTADIVVNEGVMTAESEGARVWTPIGNNSNKYTGAFDGNNKTVSGLYFNNTDTKYVGLFGYIGENGTVKNTGVINSYFNGEYYVGGVVGYIVNGTIENCYNTGEVSGISDIGGVVGYNITGTVENCYNTGEVSGTNYNVGGVVGFNIHCTIVNCYNTGTVKGNEETGGVIGLNDSGTITNCYNTGDVSGTSDIGGVVGYNTTGTVENCYNTGEVSGTDYIGGVVGYIVNGTIENCYYLDTACKGGIWGRDVVGSAEAKTAEQFKDGEVAYLLQGEQTEEIWGQKIGTDELPVLGGDKVYAVTKCNGEVVSCNNTEGEILDHNFEDGFCTICGTMDGIAQVKGYSISLGGNIAVKYYMVLSDEVLADENAEMVFTVPDTGSTYEVRIPVSSVTPDANGYYMFTCEVAAKEMASKIAAQIVTSNNESDVFEYSVKQYAEYILAKAEEANNLSGGGVAGGIAGGDGASNLLTPEMLSYVKAAPLVKAMLNYGANAQLYFNHNTDILANATLDEADKALADNLDLSEYNMSVTGSEEGVVFYGGALSLKSETAIKLYFVIDEGTAIPEVSVNGKAYELTKNGSIYELKIADIPAHILSEMYEIRVGEMTMNYGVFSYGYTAMGTDKTELKNAIKALYAYYEAAEMYIG